MHRIDHRIHRLIDYAVIVFLLFAPGLVGLAGVAAPAMYAWATSHVVLVLLTAYPQGGLWHLPFWLHGRIEAFVAGVGVAAPWLAGFANDVSARTLFVATGAALWTLWLATDYRARGPSADIATVGGANAAPGDDPGA